MDLDTDEKLRLQNILLLEENIRTRTELEAMKTQALQATLEAKKSDFLNYLATKRQIDMTKYKVEVDAERNTLKLVENVETNNKGS